MKFATLAFSTSPAPFTYSSDLVDLAVGDLVAAPFRNQSLNGIVLEVSEKKPNYPTKALHKIVRKNLLTDWQIETAKFVAEYYAAHLGKTLRLFVPERIWNNQPLKRQSKTSKITPVAQAQKKLSSAQDSALQKILNSKKPVLIHGITGSGKTEIYLRVILEILKKQQQAILLVPEIALTPQLVGYFAASIPAEKIVVIHSQLSEGAKVSAWEKIHSGEIQLVIGSRSALFAPARKLGIIILDEEHEWNYKNDQAPRYHARTVAWRIAELTRSQLIFGSATPSLETYTATQHNRLCLVELPERINNVPLPKTQIVDMRNELKKENYSIFSELLVEKIQDRLAKKEQIILLLNKRGFSSSILCRDCGYTLTCENCSLPLTFHRITNRCLCHTCGYYTTPPTACPECGSLSIRYLGSGTQKLETELARLFPTARILRADRDTTALRGSHQKIYDAFRKHEADILIGTQIIAKGLDLPKVSLVGVLLADIGLHFPDFRAGEKTFSLLTQVAGRAGRAEIPGEVVIQTYSPEHPAIQAASRHAYLEFYDKEISERKNLRWPPFSKIIKFIFVAPVEKTARSAASNFAAELKKIGEKSVWVAPALIGKQHNKYHYHVIWKGADPRILLAKINLPDICRVDTDPITLG